MYGELSHFLSPKLIQKSTSPCVRMHRVDLRGAPWLFHYYVMVFLMMGPTWLRAASNKNSQTIIQDDFPSYDISVMFTLFSSHSCLVSITNSHPHSTFIFFKKTVMYEQHEAFRKMGGIALDHLRSSTFFFGVSIWIQVGYPPVAPPPARASPGQRLPRSPFWLPGGKRASWCHRHPRHVGNLGLYADDWGIPDVFWMQN